VLRVLILRGSLPVALGHLYSYLHNPRTVMNWKKRLSLATDIAKAMEYLHDEIFMIHRDLRSPNVLVSHELNSLIHNKPSLR